MNKANGANIAADECTPNPDQVAGCPLDRLLGYVDFRTSILAGACSGTGAGGLRHPPPGIRRAVTLYIGAHARGIAAAKRCTSAQQQNGRTKSLAPLHPGGAVRRLHSRQAAPEVWKTATASAAQAIWSALSISFAIKGYSPFRYMGR